MANKIVLKRSAVASKVPVVADLDLGEIGINTYDGKMFIKKDDGTASIVEIGANSGTSSSISTDTTNFNGNLSAADTTVQLALDTLDDMHSGTLVVEVQANTTLNPDDLAVCSTTGAALATGTTAYTLTLPAAPADKSIVRLMDAHGNAQDRPLLVVTSNADTIDGSADDLTCDVNYFDIKLVYDSGTTDWHLGGK